MAGNSFGTLFKFTTFGESHGPIIGSLIDGAPSNLPLSESDIQPYLDRRRPAGGKETGTTGRNESDKVLIVSGVFNGLTTGTPIACLINNEDQMSKDYADIKDKWRPGHADFTYDVKYGHRDYRGGGRASARETAARVIAGAIAMKSAAFLGFPFFIEGKILEIGGKKFETKAQQDAFIQKIKEEGDSVGGLIEVTAKGVPSGLGDPVYDKLSADLAKAVMSINGAKSFEIGSGLRAAKMTGKQHVDQMYLDEKGVPKLYSNNAGGILGGISTGGEIVIRTAFKPTASIPSPLKTLTNTLEETTLITSGRHDACIALRAVPVVEAMVAVTLFDHLLRWLSYKK